jgi:hypothetical protein
MGVSSSALKLYEYAQMANDVKATSVAMSLIRAGSIMARDIPFITDESMSQKGVRWLNNLPGGSGVGWIKLNTDPSVVDGAPSQFEEQAFLLRNLLETDTYLLREKNQIVNPHVERIRAYMEAVAYDFNDKFFNNRHDTGNANAITGIRARIDGVQTTNAVRSENKIDASAVDLTQGGAGSDDYNLFLEYLDQLLWSVGSPQGDSVVIYANEVFMRRFSALSRKFAGSGGFSIASDQLGRSVMQYKNARFEDAGRKADQSTLIIANTETSAGADGSSDYTSVYAVNYGPGQFKGWQFDNGIQVIDTPMENGIAKRTLFQWCGGLYATTNRCLGRIYGLKIK